MNEPFLRDGLHVQKIKERRKDIMDYVKAFVVGGIICAIVQILMEKTKLMPGRIMVMLVCTGALLGAVGIYGPFSKWAGAGANVPLLGFGNVLWKGVKEAVDSEGFIASLRAALRLVRSEYRQHLSFRILRHSSRNPS